MRIRFVRDVMTKNVVSVRTRASFRAIASAMASHGVGALPVVDGRGHPVGVVSRTDLLAKHARLGHGVPGTLWEEVTSRGRRTSAASRGRTAEGLMSHRAVTVVPDDTVFRAAYLMRRHDVSHLPVVDERGVLVGIVSRGDLLGEFVREDEAVRADVVAEVLRPWLDDPGAVRAGVVDGVVTLEGRVSSAAAAADLVAHTRMVPGVVDVADLLRSPPDQHPRRPDPLV
jgi:CBS-domain-containing membrane protein